MPIFTCLEERNFALCALFVEPNVHAILNNLKLQHIYALSFYGSKIILTHPNQGDQDFHAKSDIN